MSEAEEYRRKVTVKKGLEGKLFLFRLEIKDYDKNFQK